MEGDSQRPYSGTNFRFLPTPSAWRATVQNLQPPDPSKFLPTPSHGGRRDQHSVQIYRDGFLPTPSHGGRRLRQQRVDSSTRHISTHALTWRATQRDSRALPFLFISTHALTWRATLTSLPSRKVREFLPTPSHGGRHGLLTQRHKRGRYFYPRPHMEGDKNRLILLTVWPGFLPTPSHGGRPIRCGITGETTNFYPRPHMEGDFSMPRPAPGTIISTHALTWRAT